MRTIATAIPDVLIIEPTLFEDARGFFYESYHQKKFTDLIGRPVNFVQDNHSRSVQHVLHGLHYQVRQSQGKLVRVVAGEIFDVVVDIRLSSPTFGQWEGTHLSDKNKRMLWVPPGFAHGFVVLSKQAEVLYKTTDYWAPQHERCILWNDPDLAVEWPLQGRLPTLSKKDQEGVPFAQAELFP